MNNATRVGRIVGVLLLAHLAVGLWIPFALLDRVRGSAGLLENAAAHAGQLRAAVLLLFAGSALAMAVAVAAWPLLRDCSARMAIALVAVAAAAFSLQAADNAALMSLLSLSQEYAKPGLPRSELVQAVALVAGSARRWAHYSSLLVVVSWMFLLFVALYRSRLVPRALAAFGLLATPLQIAAVTLRGFLGYPPEMRLAVPLAPAYIGLAVWLIVKGFDGRRPKPADASGARGAAV